MIEGCHEQALQWTFCPAFGLYVHCGSTLLPMIQKHALYDNARREMQVGPIFANTGLRAGSPRSC